MSDQVKKKALKARGVHGSVPDHTMEKIKEEIRAGTSSVTIQRKFSVSDFIVSRAKREMRAAGEILKVLNINPFEQFVPSREQSTITLSGFDHDDPKTWRRAEELRALYPPRPVIVA